MDAGNPEEKLQALEGIPQRTTPPQKSIKEVVKKTRPEPKHLPPATAPAPAYKQTAAMGRFHVEEIPEPEKVEERPESIPNSSANTEIIRLESEIEVMKITVKHTKEELKVFSFKNSLCNNRTRTKS